MSPTAAYLNQDEIMFGLNAKSIATNFHDYYGNLAPLYFWHLDSFWATPIIVYWSSLFMKTLSFNEFTLRLPSVFWTLLSSLSIFYLARQVFKKRSYAFLSATIFLLTPALFINSRLLLDNIYPILFVIAWLIFIYKRKYFLSGVVLGFGLHSYHAAKIYMPLCLILTLIYVYFLQKDKKVKSIILSFSGFVASVIPFVPWVLKRPSVLTNQISYAKSIDSAFSFLNIADIFKRYLTYFDPRILFATGDKSLIHSTGNVGVFTFPIVFLLVFGILQIIKMKDGFGKLLIAGFLFYPLAPSFINDPERISRALIIIPFVSLISVYGFIFLKQSKEKILNKFSYILIATVVISFAIFLKSYFGEYQKQKVRLFNYNIGGAIESVIKSTKVRNVDSLYIDKNIFFVKYYFEFYKTKYNLDDNLAVYYEDKIDLDTLPPGSIVILNKKQESTNGFELIETIREPDGVESYFVYFRDKTI